MINRKLLALCLLSLFTSVVLAHIFATFMVYKSREVYKIKYALCKCSSINKSPSVNVYEIPQDCIRKYYSEEDHWYDLYLNIFKKGKGGR